MTFTQRMHQLTHDIAALALDMGKSDPAASELSRLARGMNNLVCNYGCAHDDLPEHEDTVIERFEETFGW